jgi:Fic/DOC family N-terminal
VLSSQIEGTQSSFSDLMLYESAEAPRAPLEDVQEVSNYVAAMNHGLRRLQEDSPRSRRLIPEIHKILLSKGRGSERRPGEFRTSQNWIGGTRPGNAVFVPRHPEGRRGNAIHATFGPTQLGREANSFSDKEKDWLGGLDSNQDSQIQSLESYQLDDLPADGSFGEVAETRKGTATAAQPF